MKAILYEIKISDSWLHSTHGMSHSIFEIYIPTYSIFINYKGVWKFQKGRYSHAKKIKEIDVKITSCKILSDSIAYKETSEKICRKLLKENTRGLKTKSRLEYEEHLKESKKPKPIDKEFKLIIQKLKKQRDRKKHAK